MSFAFNFALSDEGDAPAANGQQPLSTEEDVLARVHHTRNGERFLWTASGDGLPSTQFSPVTIPGPSGVAMHFEIVNASDQHFIARTGAISSILTTSDLQTGVYEGGFKLWECAVDLVRYMANHERFRSMEGLDVAELGCGHGLPGIYALQRGANQVVFMDYNKEVLELTTCPNVLRNTQQDASLYAKASFYAGAWSSVSQLLSAQGQHQQFDVLLTAETIYTEAVAIELFQTIKRHLRRSPSAAALVAAKQYYFGTGGSVQHFMSLVQRDGALQADVVWEESDGRSNMRAIVLPFGRLPLLNMHQPSLRGLSLRGAAFGPKVRVRKKKPSGPRSRRAGTPRPGIDRDDAASVASSVGEVKPNFVPITSVEALLKELRLKLHAMFTALDPNVPTTNLYDNCSQQAFRFFTTTNTVTPEAFHHKINKLGLHASRRLCFELFELVDQEDLGELTYSTFARRIFLPAGYFNFTKPAPQPPTPSRPSSSASSSSHRGGRPTPPCSPSVRATGPPSPSPAMTSPRSRALAAADSTNQSSRSRPRDSPNAGGDDGDAHVPLVYERLSFEEIERCLSRKLEEKVSRGTDRFRQAFRFFTKSEGITYAEFRQRLSLLQFHLSDRKCREVFEHFDLDKNGTIELAEFTTKLFRSEEDETSLLRRRAGTPTREVNEYGNPQPTHRLSDFDVEAGSTLTIQQILSKLREKLEQHTSKETDRFRQAFRIFSKSTGITPPEFNAAMVRLGLKLTTRQLEELFELFDFDKSGDLDLNEFVQGVMLDDFSTKHWYTIKDKHKVEESRRALYSMAVQSVQSSWTIAEIEQMLREKIEQRTSKSSDCFRQAFRIFKKVNGIKPSEFHTALETIGLSLDRSQSDILFQRFDRNGSGDIDLDEFIHGVLPPDYTGQQWVAAADEMHREAGLRKKYEAVHNPERFMNEVEMESWSLDEIEKRIRDKIQQSTSKSSDTFRQAYRIFKKSNHITIDEFRDRLLALGFRLTPAQCEGLFRRYDTDGSNDIDLQEFCMRILPPDYTGEGDYWSHSDKYHKHRQREKLAYVQRSKNGLLTLPKFDEARVRYTRGLYDNRTFDDLKDEDGVAGGAQLLEAPLDEARAPEADVEYEDVEVVDDDKATGSSSRSPQRTARYLSARGRTSRPKPRPDDARSVVSRDSTASFSSVVQPAVGAAKYVPPRSNVLLLQRFMKVAASKRQQQRSAAPGHRAAARTVRRT
ncbi:hypothetical protein P43SY_005366 [Pythium insidiosum]|uniref:EF-hand domain-containing protein n=1 Tax=Pythium insidiosum TaxID=114742 RepID=A0AAD5QDT2_PYTIN|nr:hypothetical protein P43SY_005366 [Pythium insidiosum]